VLTVKAPTPFSISKFNLNNFVFCYDVFLTIKNCIPSMCIIDRFNSYF